jgi:PAS domain S-box-containing protein
MLMSTDAFITKITHIIHSSLDLETVYQAVVEEVGNYLHADRCFISRFDADTGELCAPTREYCSSAAIGSMITGVPSNFWAGLTEYAVGLCEETEPVDYHDIHHTLSPEAKTQLDKLQVCSGISITMHFQQCLGILFVQSVEAERVWTDEEKQVLSLIAQQAAVVTHHSDLYRQLEERSSRRRILNHLYQRAIIGLELNELFNLVLNQIEQNLEVPVSKIIQFLPKQSPAQPLKMIACRGLSPELIGETFDAGYEPHAAYTLEAKEPIVVTNIHEERRFRPSPLHWEYGLVSGVAVVIWGTQQPYGILQIDSHHERNFPIEDIQFLEALANLLGTVLERKQFEHLAHKSEQQFKLMVEGLKDYAVAWISAEGIIQSWNSAAENIFGYTADEIIGQPCKLLYTEKDILNRLPQQLLALAAEQGRATQEGPKRCRSGALIDCEITITALYEQDQQLLGYVCVARDISARRQAEQALRASEERFRSLVEGSKDYAIYLEDLQGHITSWNAGAENIYGYSSTEIVQSHFSRFLTQEEIQDGLPEREIQTAIQTGRFETEGWRIRKDGSRFWAVVVLTALYDDQEQVTGFTNITRDITERQQANEALQESQARFDRVVSGSDEGFWDWDVSNDQLYWSDRLYEMLGLTRSDIALNYESYESLLHPDDKEKVWLAMGKTIQEGLPFQEEFRMRHRSGEYRYFSSRAKPYYDQQGNLKLVSGMLADITQRKKTETALQSAQRRLSAAVTAAQAGTFHWSFRRDAIKFDAAMKAMLGMPQDKSNVTLQDFIVLVHPDDLGYVTQACEESQFEGKDFDLEYRVIWPDGSIHWIYGKGKTILGADGTPDYMTGACLETTEKKQAEAQILASYRAVRDVTNALNVSTIVAITDPQGLIIEVNDAFCRISKYGREELIGQDHRILNSGYHNRAFFQNLWTTIARGQIWKGEICNRAKDGSIYWVDTTIVPYLNEQGRPKQYVAIRHDITLQKNAETHLRQSNRDLEQFAAIASHDLQAPLRKVKMFSQMLSQQAENRLGPEEVELLQRMNLSIDTMQQLVRDLLALSRVSTEPQAFERVDLNQVLQQVSQNLEEKIQATQAEIDNGHLEAVYGDPSQLTQLLQNLMENALKYQAPGNRPMITVQSDCGAGKNCTIRIQDNGIGIRPEHVERIFQPFERLHGKSSIYTGTGIGLAICKRIVERHQGQIKVFSQPGEGATFIIELPKISQATDISVPVPQHS